ncbi:MAG: glycosyltransferase [Candidatus Moraniibacteriota bacterium]
MKKILFLFPHFLLPGGAANSTVRFARALNEKGYITEIICAGANPNFLQENKDLKFTVLNIPDSGTFSYWVLFLFWQIKINHKLSQYPDYIFFPQVLPSNWWVWFFKLTHKNQKIVWNCNEPSAFIHSKTWIKAIKNPLMRAGAIIFNPILKTTDIYLEKQNNFVFCNSRYSASDYEKSYHKKADAVIYPPSYIKTVPLSGNKQNYIFTVSRLSKFKNVNLLVEAFAKISEKFPNYTLLIAGDGEEKVALQKLATDKNLTSRIKLLGKVSDEDLSQLYANARVTTLCSKNEPFGLVPVESMMYGTPVIAHKSGGPLETVLDTKTGFLYATTDELALCLEKMLTLNDEKYAEMQKVAQIQAKEFDIAKSMEKLEDVFKKF